MHRCHSQEDDTSRVDLVAEAIQKAKQEAEMLKAKKRLEKLAAAGHDITNLQAAYEGELSCSPRPISSSDQLHIPPPPPIYLHIPPLFVEKFIPHLGAAVSEILTPRRGGKKSVVPSNMLSSRSDNPTEPPTIPGLELSPRDMSSRPGYYGDTSRRSMAGQKENFSPMKELGVQTDLTQRSSHPVEANDVSTNTDP